MELQNSMSIVISFFIIFAIGYGMWMVMITWQGIENVNVFDRIALDFCPNNITAEGYGMYYCPTTNNTLRSFYCDVEQEKCYWVNE